MEATLEMPQGKPQEKIVKEPAQEIPQPKPDNKIARLISKFRGEKNPDNALREIAQYNSSQENPNTLENSGKGLREKFLGILKKKDTTNPDQVFAQIAEGEGRENPDAEDPVAKEMVDNANIFTGCMNKLKEYGNYAKDNPYAMATILVPTALVALEKMVGIPLPKEIVEMLPGGVGGGMAGYGMAPEKTGVKGRIIGAVAGVAGGAGATEVLGKIPTGGPTELASSFIDDGVAVVVKPIANVARRARKPL